MTYAALSDQGLLRSENQDRVGLKEYGENLLMIVCDGMGGERSGATASTIAVSEFFDRFDEGYEEYMDGYKIRGLMLSATSCANTIVNSNAQLEYENRGMGTTLVAVYISEDFISVCNVGDSRGYILKDGKLEQITEDHTLVNAYLKEGKITAEEAEHHPQRHVLIRALGVESVLTPDYFELPREGDFKFLLCSDGLCGFCTDEEIQEVLEQEEDAEVLVKQLVDLALSKGGKDNVTVAVMTTV